MNIYAIIATIGIILYAIPVILLIWERKSSRVRKTEIFTVVSILLMAGMIVYLWISFGRPPMRTMGETRLWYSFFLPVVGWVTYRRWKFKWFLGYSLIMGIVFLIINLLNPEIFIKHLPPALQSPWFVPHVIVYILGYSLLAASALIAIRQLFFKTDQLNAEAVDLADNLVYSGFALITFGLLFGALWAKEAWGNYWSWDPKETWALITWLVYVVYIHYRYQSKGSKNNEKAMWLLIIAFGVMLMAWMGMKFIPAAQGSIHSYS
ncbi:MAG: cytochrome c biogenesis protein CcsA [Bacteroidales bacterium]|nr:cytochrome c biogenesis protein CcsA [Bacteroidales bacterium]MCF8327543.1 cytochrome c biogenesis protein CcsA [Bacteroidales bacterium]